MAFVHKLANHGVVVTLVNDAFFYVATIEVEFIRFNALVASHLF